MDSSADAQAVSELINMKTKVEENIAEFNKEIENVKQQLQTQRIDIEHARRAKTVEFQKFFTNKLEMCEAKKKLELSTRQIVDLQQRLQERRKSVMEPIVMRSNEAFAHKYRESLESAISFYSEEGLNMLVIQRGSSIREKRIELTQLTEKYDNTVKEIEEAKREAEKRKQMELERARHEEENKLRLEEERRRAENNLKREEFFMKQRAEQVTTAKSHNIQPLRAVTFNESTKVVDNLGSSTSSILKDRNESLTIEPTKPELGATFSQIFRSWGN